MSVQRVNFQANWIRFQWEETWEFWVLRFLGAFPLQNYLLLFGGSPPLAEVIEKGVWCCQKHSKATATHFFAWGKYLLMFTIQRFHFNLCMFLTCLILWSDEICHSQLQDFRCNAANVPSAISGYDANGEIVTHHIRLQWRWSKRLQQRKCHLENHKIRDRKIADTNPLHQPKSFDQFFVGGDESRSEKSAFI